MDIQKEAIQVNERNWTKIKRILIHQQQFSYKEKGKPGSIDQILVIPQQENEQKNFTKFVICFSKGIELWYFYQQLNKMEFQKRIYNKNQRSGHILKYYKETCLKTKKFPCVLVSGQCIQLINLDNFESEIQINTVYDHYSCELVNYGGQNCIIGTTFCGKINIYNIQNKQILHSKQINTDLWANIYLPEKNILCIGQKLGEIQFYNPWKKQFLDKTIKISNNFYCFQLKKDPHFQNCIVGTNSSQIFRINTDDFTFQIGENKQHKNQVRGLDFIKKYKLYITASCDYKIGIWNKDLQNVGMINSHQESMLNCLGFLDSKFLITGNFGGDIHLYQIEQRFLDSFTQQNYNQFEYQQQKNQQNQMEIEEK